MIDTVKKSKEEHIDLFDGEFPDKIFGISSDVVMGWSMFGIAWSIVYIL